MQTSNSYKSNSKIHNRNRNRNQPVKLEIVDSTESTADNNIIERISDDTISQLDQQERLLEMTKPKS